MRDLRYSKPKVRFYFHRSRFGDGHKAGQFIVFWSRLFNWGKTEPYDHVEVGIERPDGKFVCYSSTSRGECNGPRNIMEDNLLVHPERWDIYEKEYSATLVFAMTHRAWTILEQSPPGKYDWIGIIFGFSLPFGLIQRPEDWYCSEYCLKIVWDAIKRISPIRLSRKAIKEGFKLIKKEEGNVYFKES